MATTIEHSAVISTLAGVHVKRREIDPVEFLQMLAKDVRLITHATTRPKTLDLLQSDNVGITHGLGNALKINSLVEP